MSDHITHPKHYTKGIEAWDYIASHDMDYFQGNIIKYVTRWKLKNGLDDLRKALAYIIKYIDLHSDDCDDQMVLPFNDGDIQLVEDNSREAVVAEFHDAFNLAIGERFRPELLELRQSLLEEEMREVREAYAAIMVELHRGTLQRDTLAHFIKELADLQYVLSGYAVAFGLDLEEAFQRVHASNMSKLDDNGKPVYRADGKVLKGPNYREPDLDDLAAIPSAA